jgi:hypothetical protein
MTARSLPRRAASLAAWTALACVVLGALVPRLAGAQLTAADGGAMAAAAPLATVVAGPDASAGGDIGGCVETVPKGGQKPVLSETFPPRGTSGWAATLAVTVRHGKGERVLPAGLDLSAAVEAKKYLKTAGFAIPDQDGGAAAHLWTEPEDKDRGYSVTHLDLPLVIREARPQCHGAAAATRRRAARERRGRDGVHAPALHRGRGSHRKRAAGRAQEEPAAAPAT